MKHISYAYVMNMCDIRTCLHTLCAQHFTIIPNTPDKKRCFFVLFVCYAFAIPNFKVFRELMPTF